MSEKQKVIVTELDISFSNLIGFLIKLAIAAVPAAIVVGIFWWIISIFFFGVISGF
ncbi:MAG: hypothetical protein WC279_14780 [Sulfurimonas sp.]|jgi:ABC-type multidrug transport system permease subunit|uniref:hypothetical protein n=1 Tax=Sulfurimonas sp. TaxID=2022749 RepID=UPI0035686B26|nr:hypothetical protein [Dehalococcoidia bacterium]